MNPTDKVRSALDPDIEIRVVEDTIFTVEDAARTIGTDPSEILKSLIFVIDKSEPCLVLMSGSNKVDSRKAAQALGGRRGRMMPPEEVYERYGFHVGGVPPIGYDEDLRAVLDEDLFAHKILWATAGTDHAFFPVSPERLQELTGGVRASIKKV